MKMREMITTPTSPPIIAKAISSPLGPEGRILIIIMEKESWLTIVTISGGILTRYNCN